MFLSGRYGPLVLFALAFVLAVARAPAGAEEGIQVRAAENPHNCLNQKERRAAVENGMVVSLATAMKAVKSRINGSLVRARLCHSREGLVYVLTVLGHDGKVARLAVDAVKGTLVGGL